MTSDDTDESRTERVREAEGLFFREMTSPEKRLYKIKLLLTLLALVTITALVSFVDNVREAIQNV